MKKYRELVVNTGIFALSNVATKLVTFLCLPLYTFYLTTEEYAVVDLAQTAILLCIPIFTCAITDAVLRFGILYRHKADGILTAGLAVVGISTLLVVMVSKPLALFIGMNSGACYLVVLYLTIALSNLFSAYFKAIDRTALIAGVSLLSSVLTFILNYLFIAKCGAGISGYFIALSIGNGTACVVYFLKGRLYKLRYRIPEKSICKEMLRYSLPLVPNSVFWWVNSSMDRVCIRFLRTLADVGIYASAGKIPAMLNVVVSIFQQAWTISAIKEYNSREKDRFYSRIFIIYYIVIALLASVLIAALPIVVPLFLQKDFEAGRSVIPTLTLSFYFSALSTFYGSFFTAAGTTRSLFTTTVVGSLFNLLGNFFLIPLWGIQGAAVATLASNAAVYVSRKKSVQRLGVVLPRSLLNAFLTATVVLQCLLSIFLPDGHSGIWGSIFCSIVTLMLSLVIVYRELRKIKNSKD